MIVKELLMDVLVRLLPWIFLAIVQLRYWELAVTVLLLLGLR